MDLAATGRCIECLVDISLGREVGIPNVTPAAVDRILGPVIEIAIEIVVMTPILLNAKTIVGLLEVICLPDHLGILVKIGTLTGVIDLLSEIGTSPLGSAVASIATFSVEAIPIMCMSALGHTVIYATNMETLPWIVQIESLEIPMMNIAGCIVVQRVTIEDTPRLARELGFRF